MAGTLVIKRGDTLKLRGSFKQTNGSPMNLTGFQVEVDIIDETNKVIEITEGTTSKRSLVVDKVNGTFELVMKDTEVLRNEQYSVDFKYVSADGVAQSSKSIGLKVRNKLV